MWFGEFLLLVLQFYSISMAYNISDCESTSSVPSNDGIGNCTWCHRVNLHVTPVYAEDEPVRYECTRCHTDRIETTLWCFLRMDLRPYWCCGCSQWCEWWIDVWGPFDPQATDEHFCRDCVMDDLDFDTTDDPTNYIIS